MTEKQGKIVVIKIGGSTLGSEDTSFKDIITLQREGWQPVVVHGGGKTITEWLKKQQIATTFVRGERVTDEPVLAVVTAVLCGLVNKQLVAAINSWGGRAVGICGVDGTLVAGRVTRAELGYVGGESRLNTELIHTLLKGNYTPVIAPVSLNDVNPGDQVPYLLNNNADIIAGELAHALNAGKLIFLTDVAGILDENGVLIPELTSESARKLIESGVAAGGMIPKVNACLRAVSGTGIASIIDGRRPQALMNEIKNGGLGTVIRVK